MPCKLYYATVADIMLNLKAEKRTIEGKKTGSLRTKGILPAVLYGPEIENASIEVIYADFAKIYDEAGESSLITLKIGVKEYPVLIYDAKRDPLTNDFTHVDFYQPILTEEVEASVPLVFDGESLAVKDLGGTLLKEIQELEVKALPMNLPHEIKVDISSLKTFEDEILVKNLNLPENVSIDRELNDIVAVVVPPEKVEEELEKPVEENVSEVEKVEKKPAEEEAEEPEEK